MNMEKFGGGKKEPFVSEDNQEKFALESKEGKKWEQASKREERDAKHKKTLSKCYAAAAVGTGVAGIATALYGDPVAGAYLMTGAAASALEAKANKSGSEEDKEMAQLSKEISEGAYTTSRSIVEEGMRETGAEKVDGQLHATPEQIDIARGGSHP